MTHVPWHSTNPADFEELHGIDSVELTSVGTDIGTTTTHLMFSQLVARREGQDHSSSFEIVDRDIVYRSPIMLTPFDEAGDIDATAIDEFINNAYSKAGYTPEDIDTGAVIITGEANRKDNAAAITDLFSEKVGKFVCATAGADLEALLAAHGSGAIDYSLSQDLNVLHVDIGGGTTKFAYIVDGFVEETASINIGARLLEFDEDGNVIRIEDAARTVADAYGIELALDKPLNDPNQAAKAFTSLIFEVVEDQYSDTASELMVTDRPEWDTPDCITFSGGVAEYIYHHNPGYHHDLGPELGETIRSKLLTGDYDYDELESGIRATVAGSTNHSMQVSGNTITISDDVELPLRNVPMIPFVLDHGETGDSMVAKIQERVDLYGADDETRPIALGFHLHGLPTHDFLHRVVNAAISGWEWSGAVSPLILAFESDVGMNAGRLAVQRLDSPVIAIDTVDLSQFAYIDIGEPLEDTNAVPLTIKSLVFEG